MSYPTPNPFASFARVGQVGPFFPASQTPITDGLRSHSKASRFLVQPRRSRSLVNCAANGARSSRSPFGPRNTSRHHLGATVEALSGDDSGRRRRVHAQLLAHRAETFAPAVARGDGGVGGAGRELPLGFDLPRELFPFAGFHRRVHAQSVEVPQNGSRRDAERRGRTALPDCILRTPRRPRGRGHVRRGKSHSRLFLSRMADSTRRPSGVNATVQT